MEQAHGDKSVVPGSLFSNELELSSPGGQGRVENIVEFLVKHGYWVVFFSVFLERVGPPIPALLVLVAMGALVADGKMALLPGLSAALLACLLGDLVWYELGRRHGARILGLLCKVAIEPDTCVRKTRDAFGRHGATALLMSKFVPPFSLIAAPMAGQLGMSRLRFLTYDGGSALLWIGAFSGAGFVFSRQLESLTEWIGHFGNGVIAMIVVAVGAQLGVKLIRRRRQLAQLQVSRVTPEALKEKLDQGRDVLILDLRHAAEVKSDPVALPGALRITVESIESGFQRIPLGREVVLYCT